jgi:hypothetical protein
MFLKCTHPKYHLVSWWFHTFIVSWKLASQLFPAKISGFPITYLGLPLTDGRLRKVHLQPLVDRVAAYIPTWKASLMNKAGRLTVMKVTLTSACVHTLISRCRTRGAVGSCGLARKRHTEVSV